MELNEYWSAIVAAQYERAIEEKMQQDREYHKARMAPHILHGAQVMQDGNQWRCTLGELPLGVCGFGDTPEEACMWFDRTWTGREQ